MRNVVIILAMLLCLFGPTVVFTLVGNKAMKTLSKRPSDSARVMIALLIKLVATAVVLIGVLMGLLAFFAPK